MAPPLARGVRPPRDPARKDGAGFFVALASPCPYLPCSLIGTTLTDLCCLALLLIQPSFHSARRLANPALP
jgi:hypothetical protein